MEISKIRQSKYPKQVLKNLRQDQPVYDICNDSGDCIVFGVESVKVKQYFGEFSDFRLVTQIKKTGGESANGFIKELTYDRLGFTAYTILKSALLPSSDNLFYEAVAGQYINKMSLLFPCFLETYGLYSYTNSEHYDEMRRITKETITHETTEDDPDNLIIGSLQPISIESESIRIACASPLLLCLNIQHIRHELSLYKYSANIKEEAIGHNGTRYFIKNGTALMNFCSEIINILYQVYMPLANMCENFTHYDLHRGECFAIHAWP